MCHLVVTWHVAVAAVTLQWRHNEHHGVSNHQPRHFFTQPFIQKTSKLRVTAFVRGIHRWPVNSPHKWPVMRKVFHLMTSSWRRLCLLVILHNRSQNINLWGFLIKNYTNGILWFHFWVNFECHVTYRPQYKLSNRGNLKQSFEFKITLIEKLLHKNSITCLSIQKSCNFTRTTCKRSRWILV